MKPTEEQIQDAVKTLRPEFEGDGGNGARVAATFVLGFLKPATDRGDISADEYAMIIAWHRLLNKEK